MMLELIIILMMMTKTYSLFFFNFSGETINHVLMETWWCWMQGMGDFLNEMATMMNQSKPNNVRSLHYFLINVLDTIVFR